MTDCDFLLAVLEDGEEHSLNEILQRSLAERGCGLTVHSRAADLRKLGHSVVNRIDSRARRGYGSLYSLRPAGGQSSGDSLPADRIEEGNLSVRSDFRPPRRVKDKTAFDEFHAAGHRCLVCKSPYPNAAHIIGRGQGGDDMIENLMPLCGSGSSRCHGAFHGNPYWNERLGERITPERVRADTGWWIRSEDGRPARAYVMEKLGRRPGEAFLARQFGLRSIAA